MNKTNMALLGFISSAADYLKDKLTEDSEDIREITDIDFDELKKELTERLGPVFDSEDNANDDLIKAGRRAFEDLFKNDERSGLMSEFEDIFNVDFGNKERDEKIQNRLLELLKDPENKEDEFDIISKAAGKREETEEPVINIPGSSKEIDDIFTEILNSENKEKKEDVFEPVREAFIENISDFEGEPENFEEKVEAERQLEEELDLRPLSERLRSVGNGDFNENFSEEEMDRLYSEIDLSEIKKERADKLKEEDQNKSLSAVLRDTKRIHKGDDETPYSGEPELPLNINESNDDQRDHKTISDLLKEVKDDNKEEAVFEPVETRGEGYDSIVFGKDYIPQEEMQRHIQDDLYVANPGSEQVQDDEYAEFEETEEFEERAEQLAEQIRKDIETQEKDAEPLKEDEGSQEKDDEVKRLKKDIEDSFDLLNDLDYEDADTAESEKPIEDHGNPIMDDYIGELINGLSTNEIAKRIEEARLKEERSRNVVYDSIKEIYPYLSDGFIRGVYDLKGALAYDYPEGAQIIILHRLHFADVDGLRNFAEIILRHDYAINVDEMQMIVDVFKQHLNTDGRILTDIFEVANQAKLLGGEYEGYKIIEEDEVDL